MHEKTECRYSYFPVKRGRSVKAIRFEVETLPKQYEAPEQLEMPGFTGSDPIFDVSQSEAERRDLYRDALAPYVVTDDQIDELVQLARKHIDARAILPGALWISRFTIICYPQNVTQKQMRAAKSKISIATCCQS